MGMRLQPTCCIEILLRVEKNMQKRLASVLLISRTGRMMWRVKMLSGTVLEWEQAG